MSQEQEVRARRLLNGYREFSEETRARSAADQIIANLGKAMAHLRGAVAGAESVPEGRLARVLHQTIRDLEAERTALSSKLDPKRS